MGCCPIIRIASPHSQPDTKHLYFGSANSLLKVYFKIHKAHWAIIVKKTLRI